jgi:hypothetical protein
MLPYANPWRDFHPKGRGASVSVVEVCRKGRVVSNVTLGRTRPSHVVARVRDALADLAQCVYQYPEFTVVEI